MSGRTYVTFTVDGIDSIDLRFAAEARIADFFRMKEVHQEFAYEIRAQPLETDRRTGRITMWRGEVTTWR